MKGIYYKDGVYVLIDNDEEHEDSIYHHEYRNNLTIYGGRVEVKKYTNSYGYSNGDLVLKIDGILIFKISEYATEFFNYLDIEIVTQHLNAIEVNGVNAFMQYYKKKLEVLQEDLQNLKEAKQSELTTMDENIYNSSRGRIIEDLDKIGRMLYYLFSVIFTLGTLMNAGLENEKVISVYQSIMDTID